MPSHFLSNFKFSDNSENSVIHRQISTLWISCGLWITLWITFVEWCRKVFLDISFWPTLSGRQNRGECQHLIFRWKIDKFFTMSKFPEIENGSQLRMVLTWEWLSPSTENDYQLGGHTRLRCTNWEWVSTNNKLSENLNF